jgi:hypothetical protein
MNRRLHITSFGLLVTATLIVFGAWSLTLMVGALAASVTLTPEETPPISGDDPAPSIADQIAVVNATRLILTVNQLASLENRHALAESETGIHAARNLLLAAFETIRQANPDRSIDVYPHTFPFTFADQTITGENIVLVLRGTDPDAGAVVIGAHYDTRGADITAHDTRQPGANDNASGVAAVIEIARILASYPHRATVYCVLFSAEEEGRYGSLAFVRDVIQAQNVPLRAMINLDSVGVPVGPDGVRRKNELRIYSAPPDDSSSRELARFIAQTARRYVPEMTVILRDTLDRPDRWGDHQSFSDAGYAAARLIEPADDPQRTHNADDLPDHLDAAYLCRVTQVALAAALALADDSAGP